MVPPLQVVYAVLPFWRAGKRPLTAPLAQELLRGPLPDFCSDFLASYRYGDEILREQHAISVDCPFFLDYKKCFVSTLDGVPLLHRVSICKFVYHDRIAFLVETTNYFAKQHTIYRCESRLLLQHQDGSIDHEWDAWVVPQNRLSNLLHELRLQRNANDSPEDGADADADEEQQLLQLARWAQGGRC